MLTLQVLNAATPAEFVALLEGTCEHSPWVAAGAAGKRPCTTLAALRHALASRVRAAGREQQGALIRAHTELAGKAVVAKQLTAESLNEQGRAGLTDCKPAEFARIQQPNADCKAKFGWHCTSPATKNSAANWAQAGCLRKARPNPTC